MRKITILLLVTFIFFVFVSPSFADLFIEQNCHSVNKSKSVMTPWNKTVSDYQRRIFIKDKFLGIQLIVDNIPTKECGFDFKNKLYYEADLINRDYRKYFFDQLDKELAKRKAQSLSGMNMAVPMFAMLGNMGSTDYKVKSTKSLFRRKKVGIFKCILYDFKLGPGYSFLKPLSWGKDIKAWVTKEIPNYAQYENIVNALRKDCTSYFSKSNETSDFINILIYSDGFPVEIYLKAKYDLGAGRLVGNTFATLSKLDTKNILDSEISYFKDSEAFIVNPTEDKERDKYKLPDFLF